MKISLNELPQHLSALDAAQPPHGHLQRFEKKLTRQRFFSLQRLAILPAAAIITMILVLRLIYPSTTQGSDPIDEVIGYYNMQLNTEIEQVKSGLLLQAGTESCREIYRDLQQMYQEYLKSLEFPDFMTDEEKIVYIINNYRARMESLRNIREILEIPSRISRNL